MPITVITRDYNDSGHNQNREAFVRILKEVLLPVINKTIVLSVPHQSTADLKNDDNFHIYIWSSIHGNENHVSTPSEMYGIKVDCRDPAFKPLNKKGKTEKIFSCPNTNYAVAELFIDNLYIHHDVCNNGTPNEIAIFRRLIQDVAEWFLLKSPAYFQERTQKELGKIGDPNAKDKFVQALSRKNLVSLDETEKKLKQMKKAIEIHNGDIASYLKKKAETYAKIERYASSDSKERKIFELEYDRLLTIPDVYGVQIEDNILQVFTGMIRITTEDTGITYRIGKFRIEIPLIPEEGSLKFFNLTNDGHGPGETRPRNFEASTDYNRHHPHIKSSGEACLGNIKDAMIQYIIDHQYSVVAILALQFLKTVNLEDGAGRGIRWWPKETA